MNDERLRLLLAYAVAHYATALESLEAVHNAQVTSAYTVIGGVRRDLVALAQRWDSLHGHALWSDDRLGVVVAEARAFCTENQSGIDELTSRE